MQKRRQVMPVPLPACRIASFGMVCQSCLVDSGRLHDKAGTKVKAPLRLLERLDDWMNHHGYLQA